MESTLQQTLDRFGITLRAAEATYLVPSSCKLEWIIRFCRYRMIEEDLNKRGLSIGPQTNGRLNR